MNSSLSDRKKTDAMEEISIGGISEQPVESLRGGVIDGKTSKVTFFNVRGEEGLSVILRKEGDFELCDVDKDGVTDFLIKVNSVSSKGAELTYYDKNRTPLQTVLVNINGGVATLDVLKVYQQESMRAWFGGGNESWGSCFSRRMGSPLGISMTLIAGAFSGGAALAVGVGGALSCVLYNPVDAPKSSHSESASLEAINPHRDLEIVASTGGH